MAIAVVGTPAVASSGGNPGPSSITTSMTLDAAATLIVATVGWGQAGSASRTVSSVTYAGAALTQLSSAAAVNQNVFQSVGTDLWYKASPSTGANNLVTTMSTTCNSLFHGNVAVSGNDTTTPMQNGGNGTGTADPGTKAATNASGDLAIGCFTICFDGVADVSTTNTQQYEDFEGAQEDTTHSCATDTGTNPTFSWDHSGGAGRNWAISVGSIKAASAGGTTLHLLGTLGVGQ